MEHRGGKLAERESVLDLSSLILLLLFCIYSVKKPKNLLARESSGANVLLKKNFDISHKKKGNYEREVEIWHNK